jgi:hypothetical protein
MSALLIITHRIAVQCGAGATKGEVRNPITVAGVQKYTYKCGAIKCSVIHIAYIPTGFDK